MGIRIAPPRAGVRLMTMAGLGWLVAVGLLWAEEPKERVMSYAEARGFLIRYTQVLELTNESGARVAICPQWQGRVMTSTCGGMSGPSFGFINRAFIESGRLDPRLNNYGGEDRMWLSPEGGPFSLWFKPGVPQTLDHWYTPPALNEGAFEVISGPSDPYFRMVRRMRLENASGTELDLDVTRDVRLLHRADLEQLFSESAATVMSQAGVKLVAYETVNTVTNRGAPLEKAKGLVSIWMLGMLNAGPQTVVIVPYRPGAEAERGPVVKSDYFGPVPPDRLVVLPEAVLFRADSQFRSKIGTSPRRAKNVLGSIDFQQGVLTLVHFTMPDDPAQYDYMNNMWGVPQESPYAGDVANSYNDGPPEPGKAGLGAFYEIESLSPAVELQTGQSLTHRHRTLHIQAEPDVLGRLAHQVLGVDLQTVRRAMPLP